jgi:signal transduction histidine kinase
MRVEAAAPQLPPDFSEEVQDEIQRLSQLVERSLLAAKAEGGKLEVRTQPVDLSSLLEDLHEGYALLAREEAIFLDWQVQPHLVVASDPALLRQIFHNLMGNAIRHGQSHLRVWARNSRLKHQVLFGMTNFVRTENFGRNGTGMGLRLVRSLAHALDQTHFYLHQTPDIFSVRLILPRPSSHLSSP